MAVPDETFTWQGDASDFGKDPGSNEFHFKLHGQKHTFQAATSTERDSWLSAVESKAAEAKASRDGIIGSEGYKKHMTSLGELRFLNARLLVRI